MRPLPAAPGAGVTPPGTTCSPPSSASTLLPHPVGPPCPCWGAVPFGVCLPGSSGGLERCPPGSGSPCQGWVVMGGLWLHPAGSSPLPATAYLFLFSVASCWGGVGEGLGLKTNKQTNQGSSVPFISL